MKPEMLNLQITVCGSEEKGELGIFIAGMTKDEHVQYILDSLNKFMTDNAQTIGVKN